RSGAEETLVSGVLDVSGNPEARAWLSAHGMDCEDGTVVIRRSLKSTGRGSVYIQNVPALRQDLADFTSLLVDVHGQHEHQSLLRPDSQRRLLDRFARIEAEVEAFGERFTLLASRRREFEGMAASERERAREAELLAFAVDEISKAKLKPGEDAELEEEERLLSQFEKLASAVEGARDLLADPSGGALPALRKVRTLLESAQAIDSKVSDLARRVDDGYYELEDVADTLRHYMDALRFSPERLEAVESRIAELQRLKKKYGDTLEEVIAYGADGAARLERLSNWEEDKAAREAEIAVLEREVYDRALAVSKARAAAGSDLEERIVAILRTLGMPGARFSIRLARKDSDGGKAVVGPNGIDEIDFLISPNRGEPLRELARIASGGEMSRVMLAVKTALADTDTIGTLIFDEVDAGIGGEVALSVGEHLHALAARKQVLCITHLASIAVRADTHYRVEKAVQQDRTVTRLAALSGEATAREIARMLAGDSKTEVSYAHAVELLRRYGNWRENDG
ncbi:MAG TPA: DNA repair protein RecN, partial [Spirochaetales bacterium]|nr:DNA repair protein RecN [Spirochaetales bacterium]